MKSDSRSGLESPTYCATAAVIVALTVSESRSRRKSLLSLDFEGRHKAGQSRLVGGACLRGRADRATTRMNLPDDASSSRPLTCAIGRPRLQHPDDSARLSASPLRGRVMRRATCPKSCEPATLLLLGSYQE
jgi:hypothetical protein